MKKILFSTIIFSIILFSFFSFTFAANIVKDTKSATNNIGNAVADTSNHAKNMVQKAENTIEDGVMNTKNTIVNSSENVANGVKDGTNDVMGSMDNADGNYNATRTATDSTFFGMTTTGWTWLILAIVGIAIVGLVWYYGSQYEHTNYSDGE